MYDYDIGVVDKPWTDHSATTYEDFDQAEIDKIKSRDIKFSSNQKLSLEESSVKKQIFEHYDLILNVMSGYDDVLISATTINCEMVSAFKDSSLKIIKKSKGLTKKF